MKFKLLVLFVFLQGFFSHAYADLLDKDPFDDVSVVYLDNKIPVYLASNNETNLTSFRVEVDVGWEAENKKSFGVSHLLEHVLFRDKELHDEMSYLQLIKEAGGEANGSTTRRVTAYYGTIPSQKSLWLIETFEKMLLRPEISDKYVQTEKDTVELEIGRPSPITAALGFNPQEILSPSYLRKKGFWKQEFNLDFDPPFSATEEQLSNRRLTTEQVKEHYFNYYHPANIKIYIAGKIDQKKVISLLNKGFGKLEERAGLKLKKEGEPTLTGKPYKKAFISEQISHVTLGTKAINMDERETEVLSAYNKFLAHRLMKELRNRRGQTYTASAEDYTYGKYGYAGVYFQTGADKLNENLEIVREMIHKDTQEGLSDEEVKEAIRLTLSEYHLNGKEVSQLMNRAIVYMFVLQESGTFISPYKILKDTTPQEFNTILKKLYIDENKYEVIYRPPFLFPYDYFVFSALVIVATLFVLRRMIVKPFTNNAIFWVRNVRYPPLKSLEFLAMFGGLLLSIHLYFFLEQAMESFSFLEGSFLFRNYLRNGIQILILIIFTLLPLCLLPKKLMIVKDQFIIKSISYYSKSIPLSEISSIEERYVFTYPFPLSLWIFQVGFRCYFFHLKLWKKGVMIYLKDGRAYFFGVASSSEVAKEIRGFLKQDEKNAMEHEPSESKV